MFSNHRELNELQVCPAPVLAMATIDQAVVPASSTVLLQPTQCTLQVCPLSVAISYTIEMGHSSGGRDYIITCVVSTRLICKPTKQTDML